MVPLSRRSRSRFFEAYLKLGKSVATRAQCWSAHSSISTQLPLASNWYPNLQPHANPPSVLSQMLLSPHGELVAAHSLISTQLKFSNVALGSIVYPSRQPQSKPPGKLKHWVVFYRSKLKWKGHFGPRSFWGQFWTALSLEIASIKRSISAFINVNASVIAIAAETIETFTDECTTSVDALRSLCITCVLIWGYQNTSWSHLRLL